MKKIFLVIFLICPLICFSQKKIDGIGVFKLGDCKKKILDSIVNFTGIQIHEDDSDIDFTQYTQSNYKGVLRRKMSNVLVHCSLEEEYMIHSFDFMNMEFKEVHLDFYNDTLYSIAFIVPDGLRELLNVKYGIGKLELIQDKGSKYWWRNDNQVVCGVFMGEKFDILNLVDKKISKRAQNCWDIEYRKQNNIPGKTIYSDSFIKMEEQKIIGELKFGMNRKQVQIILEKFNKLNSKGEYDIGLKNWYPTYIGKFEYFSPKIYSMFDNSDKIYSMTIESQLYKYEERMKVIEQIDELTKTVEEKYGDANIVVSKFVLMTLIEKEDTSFNIVLKDWRIGKKDIDIYLERRKNYFGSGYHEGYFMGNYTIGITCLLPDIILKQIKNEIKGKLPKK